MISLSEHIFERRLQGVNLKSSFIEYAAIKKGLPYTRYNSTTIIIRTPGGSAIPFNNLNGPSSSAVGKELCGRKNVTLELLSDAGLAVPRSGTFSIKNIDKAWKFAETLDSYVVVKPTRLSRGRGVTTEISSRQDFGQAWDRAFSAYSGTSDSRRVVVQEQVNGEDYRIFVVGAKVVSVTHRKRPNVVGDGQSTILELIEKKNLLRSEHPTLNTYPIPTALDRLDELSRSGGTLEDVPAAGTEVTLRRASNLSGGGDSVDLTDVMHPEYKSMAVRALEAVPGLGYAGIDLIAPDVEAPPAKGQYAFTEVEFSPGPMTDFPVVGKPRDMAGAIMDFYLQGE